MLSSLDCKDIRYARYLSLLRIRMVEMEIARRYPEQQMRCPVHLSIGQEAIAVGVCAALEADDVVFSTHRSHAHYLAKGGNLDAMVAELHGRASGCCGGRGGSMHIFDERVGMMASVPIVGSNVPLAVGAALTFRQRRASRVAVAFLGDGAVEEGVVHESFNIAATHKLGVIFVVENNLYSVYTRLDQRQPGVDLGRFASANRLNLLAGDGNDIWAVESLMRCAVEHARHGQGPTFLNLHTYRQLEHCGPYEDDHLDYRPKQEVEDWRMRCPVLLFERELRRRGELDEHAVANAKSMISAEIDEAFARALSANKPGSETLMDHVYSTHQKEMAL